MAGIAAVKKLGFKGSIGELFSYTVIEDTTPLNPADSSGSVGQVTLSTKQTDDDQYMLSRPFTLTDPARGSVDGIVQGVAAAGGRSSLSADSALGRLNTERLVPPYVGTLAGAFVNYLGQVGISSTTISVDAIYLDYPVAYPGWKGNVWEHIKLLNAATGTETALVDGLIVLRKPGTRGMSLTTLASIGTNISLGNAARTVEIYNYNTTANNLGAPQTVFTSTSAYNVAVGESNVFRLVLDASLSQVYSPSAQQSILGPNPSRPVTGAYAVSGSNGLPVPVQWWADNGGAITVAKTDDPFEIEVTIVGPRVDYLDYAPFRIAEGEDAYPALYIAGVGVFTRKELVTLHTGASAATTSNLVGATIDNPFIQNLTETYTAGLRAASAYAGTTKTLTFSEKVYDKDGQEFGRVAGSIVEYGTCAYRVRSTNIDRANISGTAESFVTFGDFNNRYTDASTFALFNQRFRNLTFGEQAITPLKGA